MDKVIPDTFIEDNEDYIVVGSIKQFIKSNSGIKIPLTSERKVLLDSVIEYANIDSKKYALVVNWVDHAVKEGIKDIYIRYISSEFSDDISDEKKIKDKIKEVLTVKKKHLSGNKYDSDLKLVRFESVYEYGKRCYHFYLCKKIYVFDSKKIAKVRLYPIFVDIYPDDMLITGRAKPKQNIYEYSNKEFTLETKRLYSDKEIKNAISYIMKCLNISFDKSYEAEHNLKNHLYKLLKKYTETPEEIQLLLDQNSDKIKKISDLIIDDICLLPSNNDVYSDVINLVEKYFSIYFKDKSIFTRNRDAYPLRIMATDEEESTVDQKAGMQDPLQSKAIFFDNKKMMQKNQTCDGISFIFKRKGDRLNGKEYKVVITISKGFGVIKFSEYTEEVDIQNVLFLLLES